MYHLSVCPSVCPVYCGKMAYWIWTSFRVVSRLCPEDEAKRRGGDRPMGRDSFGWMWGFPFWGLCDVLVQKCVNWSSCHLRCEWGQPGHGVLDGVSMPRGEGKVYVPHKFEWHFWVRQQFKNIFITTHSALAVHCTVLISARYIIWNPVPVGFQKCHPVHL